MSYTEISIAAAAGAGPYEKADERPHERRYDSALKERVARAYLLAAADPPAPALAAFVAEHGPVVAARSVRSGEVPAAVSRETWAKRHRRVTPADLERAREHGVRLVIPEDDEWPGILLGQHPAPVARPGKDLVAPLALWVRGRARLDVALRQAITIVGSRQATGRGMRVAGDTAYQLAAAGTTVVSGGVAGVDASAHRGALAADGGTVAVLGYGLGIALPHAHLDLLREIADRGLLISEYALDAEATRRSYLARNRLIAAFSRGTVLVEAGVRSGAHLVATEANALGRPVMIPLTGSPASLTPACEAMLRAGSASLVNSVAEITRITGSGDAGSSDPRQTDTHRINPLQSIDPQSGDFQSGARHGDVPWARARRTDVHPQETLRRSTYPSAAGTALDGSARLVYETLDPEAGKSVEEVAEETGLPRLKVRALLPAMELDGYCERSESGWLRRHPHA